MTVCSRRIWSLLVALLALPALAHDFWISPDHFNVQSGELVRVTLMNGTRFQGDVVPRYDFHIKRYDFVPLDASIEPQPLAGRDGGSQSFLRPEESGIIVYHTNLYTNTLPAQKFTEYLQHDKLESVLKRREELGESTRDGLEVYSRCAKSLITVDQASPPQDRALGLPLELVLEQVSERDGHRVVQAMLLYEGKPLPQTRAVVTSAAEREVNTECTTDADGRFTFAAEADGAWMVTAIHMVRAEKMNGVDWQSFWASLTFALPSEAGARASGPAPRRAESSVSLASTP